MPDQIYTAEVVEERGVGAYLGTFPDHVEVDGETVDGEDITGFVFRPPNGVRAAWLHKSTLDEPKKTVCPALSGDQTPVYKTDMLTLLILGLGVLIAIPVLFLFFAPP